MHAKKHRVVNGELILAEFTSLLLTYLFIVMATDEYNTREESIFAWVLVAIGLFAMVLFPVFLHLWQEFDAEGIRLWYISGKYQFVRWRNIRTIEIYTTNFGPRGAMIVLMELLFFTYRKYKVEGKIETNSKVDRELIISKSIRTTKYINLYWNGIIKGSRKSRATKKNKLKNLDSSNVRGIEKLVIDKSDAIIDEYRNRFSALGVDLRRNYFYSYNDCSGESAVRPVADYTYDMEVTMHELHKDHNVNISFVLELVEGRVGKNEYFGNEVDEFENMLREELDFYFCEIANNGFKKCYENENADISEKSIFKYKVAKIISVISIVLIILAIIIVSFV